MELPLTVKESVVNSSLTRGRNSLTRGRARSVLAGVTVVGVVAAGMLLASSTPVSAEVWETVVATDSFSGYEQFESEWNYLYPWGSDHNGSARMYGDSSDHNHVALADGVLTLRATRISWDEGTSTHSSHPVIRYHSGAVHAKDQVLVTD